MSKKQVPSRTPVCLTIAGLDPSGGAGILADVRTFSRFGCFPAAVASSVTFQNTTGVFGAVHQSADSVRRQMEPVLDDYDVAAVKTGMLPTAEIIAEVARLIESKILKNIVVDPVVRSTSGYDLIDDGALAVLVEKLFPLADIVTPNIPEAERICKMKIGTTADIDRAAEIMLSMGAKSVLIKGGHGLPGEKPSAVDYLFIAGSSPLIFEGAYIDSNATHGTGCVLSAAIAANLALGQDVADAVRISKGFVAEAIRTAPHLGRGHSPINIDHFAGVKIDGDR